jgi:AcrR family transcriptional regulator
MTDRAEARSLRRQAIIAAGQRLFSRGPFESVPMDAIAAAAGVGKPTLYRYFPSKEDLYLAVCAEGFRVLQDRIAAAAEGANPPEALRGIIAAISMVLADQLETMSFLGFAGHGLSDRWRSLYRSRRKQLTASVRRVLAAGIRRSDFHNLDLDIVPGLLLGTIRGGLIDAEGIGRERLIETMTQFILDGLGAGGPPDTKTRTPAALGQSAGAA